MLRWIREWFLISALTFISLTTGLLLWATWPLVSTRLMAYSDASINFEATAAITLLVVVVVGYGKLLSSKA